MKQKNIMVQVARYDVEKKDFVDVVVNINECTLKDRQWARCPECGERVKLMFGEDKHYEHETRAGKPCSFKTHL